MTQKRDMAQISATVRPDQLEWLQKTAFRMAKPGKIVSFSEALRLVIDREMKREASRKGADSVAK